MRIVRKMNRDKIRQHCINNNYYTCGNNREYSHMFDMADAAVTDEEIIADGRFYRKWGRICRFSLGNFQLLSQI